MTDTLRALVAEMRRFVALSMDAETKEARKQADCVEHYADALEALIAAPPDTGDEVEENARFSAEYFRRIREEKPTDTGVTGAVPYVVRASAEKCLSYQYPLTDLSGIAMEEHLSIVRTAIAAAHAAGRKEERARCVNVCLERAAQTGHPQGASAEAERCAYAIQQDQSLQAAVHNFLTGPSDG
jgi:hypothetical protein